MVGQAQVPQAGTQISDIMPPEPALANQEY